jgi:recombination protein RecA
MDDRELRALLAGAKGSAAGAAVVALDDLRLRHSVIEPTGEPRFALDEFTGRLVELSAVGPSAVLTAAVGLVLEAQVKGEPVAWLTPATSSFYPPDLADSGVDLDALVVVRIPEIVAACRAAERLLRSGAFGLIVLDVGADADVPMAHQGRLVSLAQQHDSAVVFLTEKPERKGSLGSLVSLRAEALRERVDGGFGLVVRALKDKRRGPGWAHREQVRAPAGWK